MSLRSFPVHLAKPNAREIKYNIATGAYWDNMVTVLNNGWAADIKGRKDKASYYYQAGNYYTYLFHYARIVSEYIESQIPNGDCSNVDVQDILDRAECLFKISCVEKNLQCLSNKWGIDLVSLWNYFKQMFGIDCICSPDGIGEMIINFNGCSSFIVAPDINND